MTMHFWGSKLWAISFLWCYLCICVRLLCQALLKTTLTCRGGPPTVLTASEESRLVEYCLGMVKIGYGKTKEEITSIVQRIIQEEGRETQFREGRPGKKWWGGFLRRHPEVSFRKPEALGKERAVLTEEKVDRWFSDLEVYLEHDVDGGGGIRLCQTVGESLTLMSWVSRSQVRLSGYWYPKGLKMFISRPQVTSLKSPYWIALVLMGQYFHR